jgi:hypothetical protein
MKHFTLSLYNIYGLLQNVSLLFQNPLNPSCLIRSMSLVNFTYNKSGHCPISILVQWNHQCKLGLFNNYLQKVYRLIVTNPCWEGTIITWILHNEIPLESFPEIPHITKKIRWWTCELWLQMQNWKQVA